MKNFSHLNLKSLGLKTMAVAMALTAAPLLTAKAAPANSDDPEFKNFGTYEGIDLNGRACTVIVDIGTSSYRRGDLSRYVTARFGSEVAFRLYFRSVVAGQGDMSANAFFKDDYTMSFYKLPKVAIAWQFSHIAPNTTFPWAIGGYSPRLKAAAVIDLEGTKSVAIQTIQGGKASNGSFYICNKLVHTVKGEFTGRKGFEWNEEHYGPVR